MPRKNRDMHCSPSLPSLHRVGIEVHQQSSIDWFHQRDPQTHGGRESTRLRPPANYFISRVTTAMSKIENVSRRNRYSLTLRNELTLAPGAEERSPKVGTRITSRQLGNFAEMVVEKIVFGDLSKGNDGRYLDIRCLYAPLNVQEGKESYRGVDGSSSELFKQNRRVPDYKVLLDTSPANRFRERPTTRSSIIAK